MITMLDKLTWGLLGDKQSRREMKQKTIESKPLEPSERFYDMLKRKMEEGGDKKR